MPLSFFLFFLPSTGTTAPSPRLNYIDNTAKKDDFRKHPRFPRHVISAIYTIYTRNRYFTKETLTEKCIALLCNV